ESGGPPPPARSPLPAPTAARRGIRGGGRAQTGPGRIGPLSGRASCLMTWLGWAACRRWADGGWLGRGFLAVVLVAPDEPVHWYQPGDVAQAGDERDGQQQQGADAGQVDRPDVDVGRVV